MVKILVVDDAALDRNIARLCIEELGQSVIVAENGRQALKQIDEETPDIVLTDLQMPEMDGLELVQQVRLKNPQIPVVLMTAYGLTLLPK